MTDKLPSEQLIASDGLSGGQYPWREALYAILNQQHTQLARLMAYVTAEATSVSEMTSGDCYHRHAARTFLAAQPSPASEFWCVCNKCGTAGPCNSKGIHMRPDGITECSYMAAPQRTKPVEQVPASEPYPTNVVKVWQSKTTRWWLFDDGSVQCASIGSNAWFRANTTLAQLEACRCDTGDPVKLIYARESKPSEPPARTVEQEAEKWAEKVIAPNKLYDGAISFWDTTLPNGIPMNCGNFADTRLPNRLRSAMVRILTAFATTHATELQAKLSKANERVEAQARVIEEAQARVIEAWEDLHRKGHMEWNTCWAILGDAKSQLSKLEGT